MPYLLLSILLFYRNAISLYSVFYKASIAGSNTVLFLNNEKTLVDWSFQVSFIFSDQILLVVIFQKGKEWLKN